MSPRQTIYQNGHANMVGAVESSTRKSEANAASMTQSDYIWLDGELVPYEQATVHFLSPTLHYGPGVFEGIRCYDTPRGPAVFRLQDHLERFLNSIRALGLDDIAYDVEELRDVVCRLVRVNGFGACYIRPMLYFDGPLGLNLDAYRPVIGVAAWKWDNFHRQEALQAGLRMMVSSFTRMHPNASLTKAKINGQYVNSILAKTMAARAGFDEAIMLDAEGYVAECTGVNLFLVRNGQLYTTPSAAVLEGITRDTIMTLASDAGYSVIEQPISRDQLYFADEIFVCGTAAEVVAVREVDYRQIGPGQLGRFQVGPVTNHLRDLFFAAVHGQNQRSQEWLDYMVMEPVV